MANNTIKVDVHVDPAFDQLAKKFESIQIKSAMQDALETFAFTTERESKIEAQVDTGRMRSSILTDIGNLQARIAPHVNYATFVHDGTRYMKGRPFMALGLAKAEIRIFSGNNPFATKVESEISRKLS